MVDPMICARCGLPIDKEREEFAVLYGPDDRPELCGYLHMKCSEELEAMGTIESSLLQ